MLKKSDVPLSGNARYEGYTVELMQKLSEILGFNYVIKLVGDDSYGGYNNATGKWNGMIKEILEQVHKYFHYLILVSEKIHISQGQEF